MKFTYSRIWEQEYCKGSKTLC